MPGIKSSSCDATSIVTSRLLVFGVLRLWTDLPQTEGNEFTLSKGTARCGGKVKRLCHTLRTFITTCRQSTKYMLVLVLYLERQVR